MKKASILAAALFALVTYPMFSEETKEETSEVAVGTEENEGSEEQRLACPCQDKGEETAEATDEFVAFSDEEEKPAESYSFASKETEEEEEEEVAQDALV